MIKTYNNIIESRIIQLILNELIKQKQFSIPIHLALGHECLSETIVFSMDLEDKLVCSHRNIHYQIAKDKNLNRLIKEFKLKKTSNSTGLFGSMNLINLSKSIIYTSSILGNNLPVACGLSYSGKKNKIKRVVFAITGDGAIEEGSFYESILLAKSLNLPIIFVVENNEWSLATKINERRCNIKLDKLSKSLNINYKLIKNNNPSKYIKIIKKLRYFSIKNQTPSIIEVKLNTLGDRKEKFNNSLKYINYHAGPATKNTLKKILIKNNNNDPLYFIKKNIGTKIYNKMSNQIFDKYKNEISRILK